MDEHQLDQATPTLMALQSLLDTITVDDLDYADREPHRERLQQLAKRLAAALEAVQVKLGTNPSQVYGQDMTVWREWGFRYRLSPQREWSTIVECDKHEAIKLAQELLPDGYEGSVQAEVVRRVHLTGDWHPQPLESLVAKRPG